MPNNRTKILLSMFSEYGAHNYAPLPIVLSHGRGATLWDVDGKRYIDFLASYGANNFGHQNRKFVKVLTRQAAKLSLCSRAFQSEELCLFVKELAEFTRMDCVLAMNSGTEAVETALKLARKWGYERKGIPDGKAKIIALENNFHGRTISVVSFSTEALYRDGFGPFTPGFETVPLGDVDAISKVVDSHTVAVLVEPIQAEAGIRIPPPGYLRALRKVTAEKNILLMMDEIQTGFCRTGYDFYYQKENAVPDVLILGKSLGGGLLPLSAVAVSGDILEVLRPGSHGSTFGGNPLACAVGREVLKELRRQNYVEKAQRIGRKIQEELAQLRSPLIKEVRGVGAMWGIELHASAGGARRFCEKIAQGGVLCKETHDHVIRIAPPLIISSSDLVKGLEVIRNVLS